MILMAIPSRRDFYHLGRAVSIEGEMGKNGGSNGRTGRDAPAVKVEVVVVEESASGERVVLGDLVEAGSAIVGARGGAGGRGNTAFATSTNQTPVLAEAGSEGESRQIVLELRLKSDVAVVGAPSAGKSALLAALTKARPQVADYPYTTVDPVYGVMDLGDRDVLLLELPAVAEGASTGYGLGTGHLRHAERALALAYVIDGASEDVGAT